MDVRMHLYGIKSNRVKIGKMLPFVCSEIPKKKRSQPSLTWFYLGAAPPLPPPLHRADLTTLPGNHYCHTRCGRLKNNPSQ